MKKNIYIFIIFSLLLLLFSSNVFALDVSNTFDVKFSIDDYNKLVDVFGKDYIDSITNDEYNLIMNHIENIKMNSHSSHSTEYKTLNLSCSGGVCRIVLDWKKEPLIKSYDVFGILNSNNVFVSGMIFRQEYNGSSYSKNYPQTFSNGYGTSFKLNGKGTIYLTFAVSGHGTIYASYQHAKKNISLENSKKYTLSTNGYGSVFLFNSGISSYYDGMSGVSLSI